jgi:DNA-binding MarR family transcriptional regulator
MLVTTGATTKRIDRLERQGYVTRSRTEADGRRRIVALTDGGRELVDEMFAGHLANEAAILSPLDPVTRQELARLLGELAGVVEAATRSRRSPAG